MKNFASTNLLSESGKELDLENYGGSSECNVTGSPSHGRESRGIPLDSIKVFKDVDVTRRWDLLNDGWFVYRSAHNRART